VDFNALLIHAVLVAARQRQVMAKTSSQCVTNATHRSAAAAAAGDVSSSHERQRRGQQRITVPIITVVVTIVITDTARTAGFM